MSLRLIHSSKEKAEAAPAPVAATVNDRALVWGALGLFLLVKIPMLFVTNNPEELRDFDHFLRMSEGARAYKDFVWLYGPLAPLLYGLAMKILPEVMLTARVLTLALWGINTLFVAKLLLRYQVSGIPYWFGILFVTGLSAYPSYSHNHILATVGMTATIYYLSRFRATGEAKDLRLSYLGLLVIFFCRPVLMGYGCAALWLGLFFTDAKITERARHGILFLSSFLLSLLAFRLLYGPNFWTAFMPQSWAILETKAYPNLHYLLPRPRLSDPAALALFLKQCRAALETMMFYVHYFVWPTFILTMASLNKGRLELKTAALAASFALVASLDLLHYGFNDPMSEQAMWVRGQYFMVGTALSLFLTLWPIARHGSTSLKRAGAIGVLYLVFIWSYMPWTVGVLHLLKYPKNQFQFRTLTALTTHADRTAIFEAIQFVNSKCTHSDTVVFPQYEPGVTRLLNCSDLFDRDSYMFTRMPWYRLSKGETPYAPGGKITNGEAIQARLDQFKPRFFVLQGKTAYDSVCTQPGWSKQEFGAGPSGRVVCWRNS